MTPNLSTQVTVKKRQRPINDIIDTARDAIVIKRRKVCKHCDNNFLLYEHESPGMCCGSGKLSSLKRQCFEVPSELMSVFSNKWFAPWSRVINNNLRFSSPGCTVQGGMFMPNQPAHLRCCGQTYTRILNGDVGGPLRAWINDTSLQQQEIELAKIDRPNRHVVQAKEWMEKISNYLRHFNAFAKSLISMGKDSSVVAVKFNFTHQSKHIEQKRLSSEELALLYSTNHTNDNSDLFATIVAKHCSNMHSLPSQIHYQSPLWEPLAYPLLFPDGQMGWGHTSQSKPVFRKTDSEDGITLHEYTKYLLLHSPIIEMSGRLRQAWVLEQYLRDQHNTFDYLRKNNTKLKKAPKSIVEKAVHNSNTIMQRKSAIHALPPDQQQGLSYLKPLPHSIKDRTNYESMVLDGHDHHHEDTNETFTVSDLMYLPGYTYLPSSYPGGPRNQRLKFANAMTTASKLGGPHLFSTFTTNPLWVELHQENTEMRYPEDNMVLMIRVFKEKLALFLEDLRQGTFFEGRKLAYIIDVIEFQWRGHPHAHIVYRLQGDALTPDKIDGLITTSYQQCETEEEKKLLKTFMTHYCKKDVCIKDDKPCTEFFPKELSPSYHVGHGGYPVYKRLNNNDSRIVPCIIDMIVKYRCHINTEICSDVFIIDYLFKYIYKGNVRLEVSNVSKFVDNELDPRIPDHIRQSIKDKISTKFQLYEKDEIRRFELMHCVPATQAAWKFLGFRTSQTQPAVYVLDIQLPGNEIVHFKPDDLNAMQEALSNKVTVQEIYWNRPVCRAFDNLTLEEFFDSYVVQYTQRSSTKNLEGSIFIPANEAVQRSQDTQLFVYSRRTNTSTLTQPINRIKFVSPAHGDLYYLRMLLRHYPSRSFDDARTVKNVLYNSCHDACIARGIVTDGNEFDATMIEAVGNLFVSKRLRRLFVLIAMQGQVGVQTNLQNHAVLMSLDFYAARNVIPPFHQGQDVLSIPRHTTFSEMPYDIQQDLLQAFQRIFLDNNIDMTAYQLPLPNAAVMAELEREKTKYDLQDLRHKLDHIILKNEQRQVIDHIVTHTNNTFIDGPFGRGKSFVLDYIVYHLRARNLQVVLVTAPTGVMAIARDGFTMHGLVKMNIDPDDIGRLQCRISDHSQRAELIRGADYLVVEEGPNAHRRVWEALEAECRALRKNDHPFGGLRVICAGDFRQIPPPIRSPDERDIYNASVKSWPVWQKFDVVHLTEPIRTAGDVLWTKACDDLGNGTTEPIIPDQSGRWTSVGVAIWVDLPETVKCYDAQVSINEARDWVHSDVHDFDAVVNSALVAITNKQVDDHNNYFLDKVVGDQRIMISADTILSELPTDVKCIVTDYTDTLTHNKVPPKKLIVKVNGIYTCMRTINFTRKIMNGTVLRVLAINNKYITVLNYSTGEEDDIPRISFEHTVNSKSPIKILRQQFPLRPRYAMTSNIVQGKTIQRMLLDLRYDPFAHGQLHVSCSRVPQASGLRVLTSADRIINNRARTLNIVHNVLLQTGPG